MSKKFILFVLVSCIVGLIACAPIVKNPTSLNVPEVKKAGLIEKEYRIQFGDRLDIKFFYDPELNESVVVRPDGRISLQLIHEVAAVGNTPSELAELLNKKYSSHLKKPEIAVIVRSFETYRIYVDGEVKNPGEHSFVGSLSAMQSISTAGGFKDTARLQEVIVIRKSPQNKPMVIPLNMEKVIDGTDMSQDIALLPLDIVYVPKSPVANVNKWIDQYIRKNIPVPFGFGYELNQ